MVASKRPKRIRSDPLKSLQVLKVLCLLVMGKNASFSLELLFLDLNLCYGHRKRHFPFFAAKMERVFAWLFNSRRYPKIRSRERAEKYFVQVLCGELNQLGTETNVERVTGQTARKYVSEDLEEPALAMDRNKIPQEDETMEEILQDLAVIPDDTLPTHDFLVEHQHIRPSGAPISNRDNEYLSQNFANFNAKFDTSESGSSSCDSDSVDDLETMADDLENMLNANGPSVKSPPAVANLDAWLSMPSTSAQPEPTHKNLDPSTSANPDEESNHDSNTAMPQDLSKVEISGNSFETKCSAAEAKYLLEIVRSCRLALKMMRQATEMPMSGLESICELVQLMNKTVNFCMTVITQAVDGLPNCAPDFARPKAYFEDVSASLILLETNLRVILHRFSVLQAKIGTKPSATEIFDEILAQDGGFDDFRSNVVPFIVSWGEMVSFMTSVAEHKMFSPNVDLEPLPSRSQWLFNL